jgi:outer membrane protein X
MKKFLMLACAMLLSAAMFAQQGDKSIGLNIKYGLDEPKSTGFGIKGQYGFTDQIRGEVSFNYFLKKNHAQMIDVNANLHYVFTFGEFGVYPLAGVTLQSVNPDGGSSESKFGLNIGAGAEYPVSEKIKVNLEFTYKLASDHWDRSLVGIGVAYKF